MAGFRRILVVEDEPFVLKWLESEVASMGDEVVAASSLREALSALDIGVDLVITDVKLGDGSGVELAKAAAQRKPAPLVIAFTGSADPQEVLTLGRAGVTEILAKPVRGEQLKAAILNLAPPDPSELDATVKRMVGSRTLREVLDHVRRAMVMEALARSGQAKSRAAELLGISRQHLQKILERGQV